MMVEDQHPDFLGRAYRNWDHTINFTSTYESEHIGILMALVAAQRETAAELKQIGDILEGLPVAVWKTK